MQKNYNNSKFSFVNSEEKSQQTISKVFHSSIITLAFLLISLANYAQEGKLYKTDTFDKIVVNKLTTLELVNSDSCYVLIKAKDFNPEKFSYKIVDKTISFRSKGLTNMDLKMEIGAPYFAEIIMSGTGDIKSITRLEGSKLHLELSGASNAVLDLDYGQLSARMSGASDAKIKGFVDSLYVHTSGASDFNSFDTKSIYASVQASGASDVRINADSTVVADISGTSSLRYKKEPKNKQIGENQAVWIDKRNSDVYVSENEDTIRLKAGGSEIIIIDKDGDIDIRTPNIRSNKKFTGNWAGIELGVNGFLNPNFGIDMPKGYEFMELKYDKSMNFNLNFFQQSFNIIGNKFGFVTGLGFRWLNYRFDDNIVLEADSSQIYGFHDNTVNRSYSKSKLTAWYLVIPIMFELQSNGNHDINSFHLAAGVIGGLKLGSHTKQVYTVNGSGKHKPKVYDDFHLQPFTLDATVRLGWGPLNLYANYSLLEMFRKNTGPEVYPFAIGLILPFT